MSGSLVVRVAARKSSNNNTIEIDDQNNKTIVKK